MKTPTNATPRLAIVLSQFNPTITDGLLMGALDHLRENQIPFSDQNLFRAPGAFEIPLIAQKLATCGLYHGIICLGCVIKGDTAHFEFISLGVTLGLMNASLKSEVPITFGILTTYTDEQAIVRSREDAHNKGREAADACLESIRVLNRINESTPLGQLNL